MRLLLVRHGQTPSNVLGRIDTARPGPGLTELGGRQAAEVPAALDGESISAIYVSPLVRTRLTAAPLAAARGITVVEREGLQEIEAGSLESLSDDASLRTYMETVFAWAGGDLSRAMPDGPDGHAFFGRFDRAIAGIEADGHPSVVAVSHGAAIRAWAATRAVNVEALYGAEHPLDNTGLVELVGGSEAGWTIVRWQGQPLGGADVADRTADDPTGESLLEASRGGRGA